MRYRVKFSGEVELDHKSLNESTIQLFKESLLRSHTIFQFDGVNVTVEPIEEVYEITYTDKREYKTTVSAESFDKAVEKFHKDSNGNLYIERIKKWGVE